MWGLKENDGDFVFNAKNINICINVMIAFKVLICTKYPLSITPKCRHPNMCLKISISPWLTFRILRYVRPYLKGGTQIRKSLDREKLL